ncbi:DUF4334 domain-containing protein [Halostreptopolyspora alba]|uniref:DUF4334 domain-containing protein n=1 Tax=Halostreptopolyspora alba TaxID=2487137 RepID=A0A3N0E2Z9_9ACTN|nr:DUF4334 domain-containing protein [Nocardiopsaceae bacterium YIM 96095]
MTSLPPETLMAKLRANQDGSLHVDHADLERLWDHLSPVGIGEILGSWRGSVIRTGHPVESFLSDIGWYGKTFHAPMDAKPLICRDDHGELHSDVTLGKGEATLWMIEFRGQSTASMVYDGRAIVDHFKRLDEDTLLGVMNGRDVVRQGKHCHFLLRRA